MSKSRELLLFCVPGLAVFLFAATVLGATPSNTVPTSSLVAYFGVVHFAGAPQSAAAVYLYQVIVENGQMRLEELTQSPDDVVSFAVGQSSITYDPAQSDGNDLPYVANGTYSMNFKRFNGEVYSSTVVMPELVAFSAPLPNSIFKKTDAVDLAWTPVPAMKRLFMMASDCDSDISTITFSPDYSSAKIPAGWASPCPGDVFVQFGAGYANVGKGFGPFTAASIDVVTFSYGANARPLTSLRDFNFTHSIAEAARTGQQFLRVKP